MTDCYGRICNSFIFSLFWTSSEGSRPVVNLRQTWKLDVDKNFLNTNIIYVYFREELKKALEKIKNFDDLLCDIVNICLLMFEQKTYLTPAEKHMLVKVNL